MSATSTPEVGSCFCLRVPLRVATAPVPKTVNQAVRLDGLRLLLIEDNPLTQRITVEMLNSSGAQVVAVGNAAQALETLQNSEPFAAALVDFDLPDIDGITLARQLAQQYPSLVLIGFSAHVIDETLRQRTSSLFRGIILNRCRVKCSVNYWRTISNCKSITINHWMYRNSMKMLI